MRRTAQRVPPTRQACPSLLICLWVPMVAFALCPLEKSRRLHKFTLVPKRGGGASPSFSLGLTACPHGDLLPGRLRVGSSVPPQRSLLSPPPNRVRSGPRAPGRQSFYGATSVLCLSPVINTLSLVIRSQITPSVRHHWPSLGVK